MTSLCIPPIGDFLESCRFDLDFDLSLYRGNDTHVPDMCRFEAECDNRHSGTGTVNVVFLPTNTKFTEMSNVGGYLTYGKSLLNSALALEDPTSYSEVMDNLKNGIALKSDEDEEALPFLLPNCAFPLLAAPNVTAPKYEYKPQAYECKEPAGSYSKSCDTSISRYTSTDKNLANTELCEVKLNCQGFEAKVKSSTVYFNIAGKDISTTVQKLENCNGAIVIGNLDDQCSGKEAHEIKKTGSKKGKSGTFRS